MNFYDRVEIVLIGLKDTHGLSKQDILMEAKINPNSYYQYKRTKQAPNPEWLEKLGGLPYFPVSATRLKAWKLLDEVGGEVLGEAWEISKTEREETH